MRTLGKKLLFIDIVQAGHKLQILCDQQNVEGDKSREEIANYFSDLQRGDIIGTLKL